MPKLNLALNKYAFHWSFPEILADDQGLFKENGIDVNWTDVTPKTTVSKGKMYTDLLTEGITDV